MNDRIVEFIHALRAAGVRVSIAESEDCFRAVDTMGVMEREAFRLALQATLVKENADRPAFDKLFPLFFGSGQPPMAQPQAGLSPEEQRQLERALQQLAQRLAAMLRQMRPNGQRMSDRELQQMAQQLMQMLRQLLEGEPLSGQQMQQAAQQMGGFPQDGRLEYQPWLSRRMERQLGMDQLERLLQELWKQLQQMGMDADSLQRLQQMVEGNQQAMEQQIEQFVGENLARQPVTRPQPRRDADLMHRPFRALSEADADELRHQVRRLAASLRSRAALRQKRGKGQILDSKATIRASLRYGGTPFELHWKRRHLKPKLVLIADVSTSMRPVAEFMLRLMYELKDQVQRTHSFAFIEDLNDINEDFRERQPDVAVENVLDHLHPGHYNTDLGTSLQTFCHSHLSTVDRRTTVIILGDGRNNYNDPRLDMFDQIKRHARRMIWMNPEPEMMWGTGDSDMLRYVPLCDTVHQVSNLAELVRAVDHLLGDS